MILSLIEYGDVIYSGTSQFNLKKIVNLFYRGLRICENANIHVQKNILCHNNHVAPLEIRRNVHLLLFMHKQKKHLLKKQ